MQDAAAHPECVASLVTIPLPLPLPLTPTLTPTPTLTLTLTLTPALTRAYAKESAPGKGDQPLASRGGAPL